MNEEDARDIAMQILGEFEGLLEAKGLAVLIREARPVRDARLEGVGEVHERLGLDDGIGVLKRARAGVRAAAKKEDLRKKEEHDSQGRACHCHDLQ